MSFPFWQGLPQFSSQSRLFSVDGYEARLMWVRAAIKAGSGAAVMNTTLRWMGLPKSASRRVFPIPPAMVISDVHAAPLPRVWRIPSTWIPFGVPLCSRIWRCCLCLLLGLEHLLLRLITVGVGEG